MRIALWIISVLLFSFGLSGVGEAIRSSGAQSSFIVDLFIGILLTTVGILIYVHKLRVPPARDPRP